MPQWLVKYSNCSMYAAAILRTLVSVQCTSKCVKWCKTISEGVLLFSFFFILFIHNFCIMIKFIYSKKATKIWQNLPTFFKNDLLGSKKYEDFIIFLWPSQNVWGCRTSPCYIWAKTVKVILVSIWTFVAIGTFGAIRTFVAIGTFCAHFQAHFKPIFKPIFEPILNSECSWYS